MDGVKANSQEIIADDIDKDDMDRILGLLPDVPELLRMVDTGRKVTYKEIIDLLEVQRRKIPENIVRGGKSKKVRKLKKYKKVFRKKSKKLRR